MCAERIEKWVDGEYLVTTGSGQRKVQISAASGVAFWQAGDTAGTILQRADAGMDEHNALIRAGCKTMLGSACTFRYAALRFRFFFRAIATTGVAAAASGFFGGLPRRFAEPWRASIARFNLSRSAISRAMICSVGIEVRG